ncbi:hypothetical protein PtB15_3B763 [Puccinia triticina]|nr:hypothetical protein PtB15_3B763 [Puccinia triticina]
MRARLQSPEIFLESPDHVRQLMDSIVKRSETLRIEREEIAGSSAVETGDPKEQKLRLLLWDAKAELFVQAVQLNAERQPLINSMGSRIRTRGKEKIIKAMKARQPAVKKVIDAFNQLYTKYKAKYPNQQLSDAEDHPLTYQAFSKWPMDHRFWNDGLYYHSSAPWSIDPDVWTGINCVLILQRTREEFELIAQELARAKGWVVAHHTKIKSTIDYINTRVDQLQNNQNLDTDYIDDIMLGDLTRKAKMKVICSELQLRLKEHEELICDCQSFLGKTNGFPLYIAPNQFSLPFRQRQVNTCPVSWIFLFTSRLSHSMSQPHGNHQTGYGSVPLYLAQHHRAPPSVNKSGSEIYPLGSFSPGIGHPNSYVGPNLFGNSAQAPTCSRGIGASPHDYQSLQNSSGFPVAARGTPVQLSHSPASQSNYSGHIGPQGHHSQVLFLQSPLERAAPPTQLLQSTPQGSPFEYTFSSPLPGRNPSFQFSAPPVSKPPPKKRAPRRKAPSRSSAKDAVPLAPTPAAPAEASSAETQTRIPLSDAPQSQEASSANGPNVEDSFDDAPPSKRQRAPPEVMEKIQTEPLDQLRDRATRYAMYVCLTPDDKLALEEAYRQYQRSVHLIVIDRRLHPQPALQYLGNEVRIRGPTNFNNFCVYDEVASPIYHDKSQTISERMVQCGELWQQLDEETKDQWRDQEFLDTISPPDNVAPGSEQSKVAVTQWKKRERFKLNMWVRKMKRDLKNLRTSHQVEGFFALASRDPDNAELITGGSILAEEFLDVLEKGANTCQLFYNFINGQQAVKEISGDYPRPSTKRKRCSGKDPEDGDCPYDLGSKVANAAEVRAKLKQALFTATHGAWNGGWPGTKTVQKLKAMNVTLQVLPNNKRVVPADFCARPSDMRIARTRRILTAFANGWVRLVGPPNPDASEDQIQALGHEPDSDEPDESPGITVCFNGTQITSKHPSKKGVKRVGPKLPAVSKVVKSVRFKCPPRKPKNCIPDSEDDNSSFYSEDDTSSSELDDGVAPKRRILTRQQLALVNSTGMFRKERSVTPVSDSSA